MNRRPFDPILAAYAVAFAAIIVLCALAQRDALPY